MYTLSDDQIASVEGLIGKLEDSLIKSRVEKWLAEVTPTKRVTSEQMEQFVSFATHLPKEVQNFPQSFAHTVKNAPETAKREASQDIQETAELNSLVDESIADVADASGAENSEETLHKLGRPKGAKGIVKAGKTKSGK
jgi:hypothetical protein